MNKLDSAELWLLKNAVESKMKNLMEIIKETKSDTIMELYGDYAALLTKLAIIDIECKNEMLVK